jgi:Secretion system C-terminal sorting domain
MKKNLLLFISIFMLVSVRVSAQNPIENPDQANNYITDTTINHYGPDFKNNMILSASLLNTIQVPVNYHLSQMSPDAELKSFDISAAYPNPASGSTSFEYTIPDSSNGKIMLRNLLGGIVREVNFEKPEGKVVISTNDLKDGIYFYSVLLNNKVEITRKLVIRH